MQKKVHPEFGWTFFVRQLKLLVAVLPAPSCSPFAVLSALPADPFLPTPSCGPFAVLSALPADPFCRPLRSAVSPSCRPLLPAPSQCCQPFLPTPSAGSFLRLLAVLSTLPADPFCRPQPTFGEVICGAPWPRCTPWRGAPSSAAPWESVSPWSCRCRMFCSRCAQEPFRGCG